jgi:hypothetical protein
MVMLIFNLCLWFATVDYILHIHVIMKPYYIVLHLLNKLAFIILLEITDSLRYFCSIISLYIIYWYRIWGGRISGFPRLLGGFWWQCLRLACLSFCGLLCFSPLLYYFWTIFIFMLVCNNNILVILVYKLYVIHVAQILSLCVIIQLHFIYLFWGISVLSSNVLFISKSVR